MEPFEVTTLDGVRIAGVRTGDGPQALVLCHGFLGNWRRSQNVELAGHLAKTYSVYLLDFRGHGDSAGRSTVGDREALDVHAVVTHARQAGHTHVVTIGASMGAVSVLREAARFHDVDGVVSISSPGRWSGHGRFAAFAGKLVTSRGGRFLALKALKTDVYPEWTWSPPPLEMIEHVTAPVLIVHGTNDKFIPKSQAQLLYNRAKPPKRLMIIEGFGHAELGYTPTFASALSEELSGMLGADGWGT